MKPSHSPLTFLLGAGLSMACLFTFSCGDDTSIAADAEPPGVCPADEVFGDSLDRELFEYDYSCSGAIAASGVTPSATPPSEDCSAGIWPDLDPLVDVCPTFSDMTRLDPDSGLTLPLAETRTLPLEMPVNESGSFLVDPPTVFPGSIKIVAWNMEYTSNLDEQIVTLTTHPDLRDADVYLLSEVDRCSDRNGSRRAARMLAQAISGDYVYAIEYVELKIDRTTGGDTGQAIVSRRPLSGASTTCHSQQKDWLASDDEPRLGQRVALHADIPAGDTSVRVSALHFESADILGESRVAQAKEVLDQAQRSACERPQVIAGDFNAWYCSAPELEVFRKAGYEDAMRSVGDTEPTHDNGLRLDYVWSRGVRVVRGGVARDVTTSDHSPLWVELELQ